MQANAEYLARLIKEKENLSALPNTFEFKHAVRLVNEGTSISPLIRVVSRFFFFFFD